MSRAITNSDIERVTLPARWINDIGSPRQEKAEAALMAIGWKFDPTTGVWASDDPSSFHAATDILLEWAPWLKDEIEVDSVVAVDAPSSE